MAFIIRIGMPIIRLPHSPEDMLGTSLCHPVQMQSGKSLSCCDGWGLSVPCKGRRTLRSSTSVANDMTSAPTIGEQELRVMTLRTVGTASPWTVTMFAIWMTGSCSGSGKWPFTKQSNLKRYRGDTVLHSKYWIENGLINWRTKNLCIQQSSWPVH